MNRAQITTLLSLALAGIGLAVWQPWQPTPTDQEHAANPRGPAPAGPAELRGQAAARTPDQPEAVPPVTRQKPTRAPAAPPGNAVDPIVARARRLDWEDEDPAPIFDWHRQVDAEQNQFIEAHGKNEDFDGTLEAARGFNDTMKSHRETLVNLVGEARANKALRALPLYQFNLASGEWHRVDARGEQIEFRDRDKEHIWENFRLNRELRDVGQIK